jgi:hypothetical protein
LHIATFTSLSFVFDPLIIFLTIKASKDLPGNGQLYMVCAQLAFMVWTKVIKLVGLFMREPWDIVFLPISVLFGYFHGGIKLWAFATLRMVRHVNTFCFSFLTCSKTSWGSRADGDTNDSQRMTPRTRRSESITLPPGNHPVLIRYNGDKSYIPPSEKSVDQDFDPLAESMLHAVTDPSNDVHDPNDSGYNSECEPHGR